MISNVFQAISDFFTNLRANPMFLPCIITFVVSFAAGFWIVIGTAGLNKEKGRKKGFKRGKMMGTDKYFDEKIEDDIDRAPLGYDPTYLEDDMEYHSSKKYKSESIY